MPRFLGRCQKEHQMVRNIIKSILNVLRHEENMDCNLLCYYVFSTLLYMRPTDVNFCSLHPCGMDGFYN